MRQRSRTLGPKTTSAASALLVYEGDFDTSLDAAAGERNLATQEALAGQLSAALERVKRAVELAPASAMSHRHLCKLMADTRVDSALEECNTARNLFLNDPLRDERGRKSYLDSVNRYSYGAQKVVTGSFTDTSQRPRSQFL